MNKLSSAASKKAITCVDDVRRVREKLSREMDNDINRLADHAHQVSQKLYKKLGLRLVK